MRLFFSVAYVHHKNQAAVHRRLSPLLRSLLLRLLLELLRAPRSAHPAPALDLDGEGTGRDRRRHLGLHSRGDAQVLQRALDEPAGEVEHRGGRAAGGLGFLFCNVAMCTKLNK